MDFLVQIGDSISLIFTFFQYMLNGFIQWMKILVTIPSSFTVWLSTGLPAIFVMVATLCLIITIVLRIFGR